MGSRLLSLLWLALALLPGPTLCAQTPEPPAPPAAAQEPLLPITTLHVYMDLIQVPVLVLDFDLQRMKPVDPSRFLVSLDDGPQFHPKHVRQEGDDPITLGIFLDPASEPELMPKIAATIAGLAPGSLHPKDHVTIFALDCVLRQSLTDAPADSARLKSGADAALEPWFQRRKARHPQPCLNPMQLWDAMAYAMQDLAQLPGRRVLLALTDGVDGGSTLRWDELKVFAQAHSIAVFGVRPNPIGIPVGMGQRAFSRDLSTEDPFSAICQSSGGMVTRADYAVPDRGLRRLVTMVRERYILEFTRARNDSPGHHIIDVRIARNGDAYVRPAGITIMLSHDELANDPNTIPRDTTDAPIIGERKILPKSKGPF